MAVAEKLHLPLLKLALDKVQDGTEDFQKMFKAAARWKAVLLIDECDTYLETRSSKSKDRNEIVNSKIHPAPHPLPNKGRVNNHFLTLEPPPKKPSSMRLSTARPSSS